MIGETAPTIRMVDDLPAPFGPRKPNDSPRATVKSTASTALKLPNRLVSARAWIIGARGSRSGRGVGSADIAGTVQARSDSSARNHDAPYRALDGTAQSAVLSDHG
ncbi:MAG: hypothetical protein ABI140_16855 [Jatrophihabitantaceae bacterium]